MHTNQVKHPNAACVRDTKHAVRQCEALAQHRSAAKCAVARPER
ncbi:MAG: hypothetical protein RML38_04440 [Bacteroidia bacterium]|nr:hypothetical protein [Bacteroidia bacterium]